MTYYVSFAPCWWILKIIDEYAGNLAAEWPSSEIRKKKRSRRPSCVINATWLSEHKALKGEFWRDRPYVFFKCFFKWHLVHPHWINCYKLVLFPGSFPFIYLKMKWPSSCKDLWLPWQTKGNSEHLRWAFIQFILATLVCKDIAPVGRGWFSLDYCMKSFENLRNCLSDIKMFSQKWFFGGP